MCPPCWVLKWPCLLQVLVGVSNLLGLEMVLSRLIWRRVLVGWLFGWLVVLEFNRSLPQHCDQGLEP